MAVPIILGGIALVTAATGIGKGVSAVKKNTEASKTNKNARRIYDQALNRCTLARDETQESLESLGASKLNILDKSINKFVDTFVKLHNIEVSESVGLSELSSFVKDEQGLVSLQKMGNMASSMISGLLGGGLAGSLAAFGAYSAVMTFGAASTGTAIATLSGIAATNATMAFLGGGAIAAGGLGIAGGTVVLGSIVAGPALAVLGVFMDAKARKNLDIAKINIAEANKIAAELNVATVVCKGITTRANLFSDLLDKLESILNPLTNKMEFIIEDNGTDYSQFSSKSKEVVAKACATALAIKKILDTPILTEAGALTDESKTVSREIGAFIDNGSAI